MFALPEQLPATVAELDVLLTEARTSIADIQSRHARGEQLSEDDLASLRTLITAFDTLTAARSEAETNGNLLQRATDVAAAQAEPEPEPEPDAEPEAQAEAQAEAQPEAEDQPDAPPEPALAAGGRPPVSFAGVGADNPPAVPEGPGWEMVPGAPNFREGRLGFRELALALDQVRPNTRRARGATAVPRGSYFAQSVARLRRDVPLIEDSHALVAEIERATDQSKLPGGSLTAAGGWCAPSEQLYTFCDVPDATDLLSLPEITINRGGIRWPVEPDLTSIFDSFQFFFTEPELEDVDSGGDPTATKECVEIPCPDEYEEIRLNAVGYCVEAGILQTQGWPELIEWFMRSLAAEHLRALSRRTILDMVAGSTVVSLADSYIGAVSSVLNHLALQAVNLRLNRGLSRGALIEGVAPSWFAEVLRADLAMQGGRDMQAVTDGEINGWLTARGIALQYVGDWQTRGAGEPGNLLTTDWPSTVDVLLYPAGTWFRSMSNVIELGVMYPREQLQVNRYTRFFTEDAIAVGKRCEASLVVTVPICVSGAIGARQEVACSTGSV